MIDNWKLIKTWLIYRVINLKDSIFVEQHAQNEF